MSEQFRFGVAVGLIPTAESFLTTARGVEQLGYSTLVMADGLWLPAPFAALTAAATATSTLRVGTQVLAVPCSSPAAIARDTETLDLLSDHRFELGLGTGAQPATAADAERLGLPFGTREERVAQVAETIAAVKALFEAKQRPAPPVLIGGLGRSLVDLAVNEADSLTIPVPYDQPEDGLTAKVAQLRTTIGDRLDKLELAVNALIVGDNELPAWVPPQFRELPADSHGRLSGSTRQIADTLLRRRERSGISYVTVPQWSMADFAPVVELLAGS